MRRHLSGWLGLLLLIAGCRHPIRTDSVLHIAEPVAANVTADLQPLGNRGPLMTMVVDGQADCGTPRVAIVDIDGLLLNVNMTGPYSACENPVAMLREKLDAVRRDPQVCAVVLRINSPGGGVAATDIMWQELQSFRARCHLPMVACLMDVSTGGGYYLATAADAICAYPGTVAGGIGVILNCYNLQDTMQQYNVVGTPIKAGENIDMGSVIAPMKPETREWLQQMANDYHRRFQDVVRKRRPRVAASDETNFDGRVFTAGQALERGLIDQIGSLEDAVRTAREMARQDSACVIMYHRQTDPARTPYAVTANSPSLNNLIPLSLPGIERSRLPTFLYLWQLDPTLERAKTP